MTALERMDKRVARARIGKLSRCEKCGVKGPWRGLCEKCHQDQGQHKKCKERCCLCDRPFDNRGHVSFVTAKKGGGFRYHRMCPACAE